MARRSLKLDHPRASSTDDVECFFSMMRDSLGRNFDSKQVQFGIRKVYSEFIKCLDPDLPFYYHTLSHTRFYEGSLPDFNQPSLMKPKTKRVPRREQPIAFVQQCLSEEACQSNRNSTICHWNYLLHLINQYI